MSNDLTRRDFLKRAAALGLVATGIGELGLLDKADAAGPILAVAAKGDPASRTRAAIGALGGIKKFVKKGDVVLVKPNLGWARKPDQAATTNPEVVAEIVRLCREAGAREVKVMDHPVDRPDSLVLRMTGLESPVKEAGGKLALATSAAMYQQVSLPKGKAIKTTDVLRDLLKADVFINVPIAKVHNSTGLTLGLKNLLGVVWDRGSYHRSSSLDQAIVDLAMKVQPHLTVLDANRILLTNGPKGPGKTEDRGLVIASVDPVAVDAYGATLFGQKPASVGHIKLAAAAKLGQSDLKKVTIRNV
jgi:uncharacterized protein (DUF362 family)